MMAPQLVFTPVDEISKIHAELQKTFKTGKTKSIAFRKEQLAQVGRMLKDNEQRWRDALRADLGRPDFESDLQDIGAAIGEVKEAYDNVAKWAKPERAPMSYNWFAMRPTTRKEPKGTVLVISPFNFPVFLGIGHFAGALAAGNTVVLKPSELTPATAALMAELFPQYLDSSCYRLVNGDVPVVTKLLQLPWGHILYTGSGRIGKIVLTAAAKHLTPVTTELGGKSPVVVDPACDMKVAARRILWGRLTNAGQVCISPDYVLVPRSAQDKFVKACVDVCNEFFPDGAESTLTSGTHARIVTEAHTARIKSYIDETRGKVVYGGQAIIEKKWIAPTVIRDVDGDDATMQDEIFGPVLPIVPVQDVGEAIDFINARDHPLALYVFSQDAAFKNRVFDNTQSGSAIANECNIHVAASGLPFGGVGASGSGYLTGKYSFLTFTHLRGTLDNPKWTDSLILNKRYPPYTTANTRSLVKSFVAAPPAPGGEYWALWVALTLLGSISAMLIATQSL